MYLKIILIFCNSLVAVHQKFIVLWLKVNWTEMRRLKNRAPIKTLPAQYKVFLPLWLTLPSFKWEFCNWFLIWRSLMLLIVELSSSILRKNIFRSVSVRTTSQPLPKSTSLTLFSSSGSLLQSFSSWTRETAEKEELQPMLVSLSVLMLNSDSSSIFTDSKFFSYSKRTSKIASASSAFQKCQTSVVIDPRQAIVVSSLSSWRRSSWFVARFQS